METDQNTPQQPTEGTTQVQPPAADSPAPGAQPDGTTLDTRPAAAGTQLRVGDNVAAIAKGGAEDVHAVVLEHALVARLADLAQRVRDFVGDEARPLVNELMTVAADVRQYL